MAIRGRWFIRCCVFFVLLSVVRTDIPGDYQVGARRKRAGPARDFHRHALITPRVFHGRDKREISHTRDQDGGHVHDLTIGYVADGKDYVLDLRLNRELIPETYFEKYQHNGRHVVNRPTGKDVELCQYKGHLRGVPGSWAAISTCNGLSGVIFDGEELHYLERGVDTTEQEQQEQQEQELRGQEERAEGFGAHYLYKHSDLATNHSCGYSGTPHHILENQEINRILRYKRDTEIIRGPYNANKQSRYVELVLVVDNKEYKKMEDNLHYVYNHCKEIANIINSLYVPLNIFIALVGVVVWTENDEIPLSNNGDQTLQNFLQYRRDKLVKEHPNDNAQLLTRVQFDGGVVGKALKGPICTYEFSGGVSTDHSEVVGLVATTVAHEMGHNFGMEHDTQDCKCPSERCIMASSSNSMRPTQWSSCSLEYLALAFEHGMDYCLRNKPKSLFDSPVCGNGFVEAAEQCDCGLKESCDNPCCNATTCMLYANASCATGECCDLQTCRPKTAGSVCRSADHECDLPEYCTGQSEYCPGDVYKMDGETCDRGKAFCFQGTCRTHSDQCRLLWGPSGKSSDLQCYAMNTKGTRHGNCGYNRLNKSYIRCMEDDVQCGMLHCKHLNERLEFGMESVAILSHSFINSGGSIIPCRTAIVDLGLNEVDPGLAPDGAKCGSGKMCVNQRCMAVGDLRKGDICPKDCNGNGVCNSEGHCHCKMGFGPPHCDYPGTGGSLDSGPASDPNARRDVMTALYVIFLGIVPFVALIALFMYYTRRNIKHWWKKGSRSPSHVGASDNQGHPPSKPGEKKLQHRISRGNSIAFRPERGFSGSHALEISSPLPAEAFSSDNAHASLLPKADGAASGLSSSASGSPASLQSNLLGQFKGFSITPLPSSTSATAATTSTISQAKPPSPPARNITSNHVAPPVVPSLPSVSKPMVPPAKNTAGKIASADVNSVVTTTSATSAASIVAPSAPARPLISSPVLDATTCTAKELIDAGAAPAVPMRPAPQVPNTSSTATNKPARPLSSPNALNVNVPPAFPENSSDEKKRKDSGGSSYPTLTRLASFMMRQNANPVSRSQSQNQGTAAEKIGKHKGKVPEGTNSLPRKVNKLQIDREALRNLEISNPIPQQEIEIPQKAVPIRVAPPPPGRAKEEEDDASKNVVMRAQSLRGNGPVTQRPAIQTFGSMRQQSGTKRPTSIPACTRPTSPPPRPPPLPISKPGEMETGIIGLPGYQNPPSVNSQDYAYDDCLNLIPSSSAPLANIDEESSPTRENIYAVIEESPPEGERRKLGNSSEYTVPMSPRSAPETPPGKKFEYTSPSFNEYKTPKPIDNSVSAGSVESVGLLSEIVNEIQARNTESIYSTSTLGRKKKEEELRIAAAAAAAAAAATANSSTKEQLPDKASKVATSNSSLGTYVNTPYSSSSIYKPMGSVYSNVSSQNDSTICKPSMSSSSSSSGYLSPMNVVNSNQNSSNSSSAKDEKTKGSSFRAAPISAPLTTAPAIPARPYLKSTEAASDTGTKEVNSYKPYSSSLTRSLGPMASTFRTSPGGAQSITTNKTETAAPNPPKPWENKTKPVTSLTSAFSSNSAASNDTKSSNSADNKALAKPTTASVLPNKSTLHSSIAPSAKPSATLSSTAMVSSKPSSTTTPISKPSSTSTPISKPSSTFSPPSSAKPSIVPSIKPSGTDSTKTIQSSGVSGNSVPKLGTSVGKTPDVVSSCAVGGNAGKSPDVVGGGKIDSKPGSKQSTPEPSVSIAAKPSVQSRVPASGISRTQSAVVTGAARGTSTSAGAASVHSSFRGKSPKPAPKALGTKGDTANGPTPAVPDKKNIGGTGLKETKTGVGRGGVTKSASDATNSKSMPPGARVAASKLSHVASLQQKFETAATGAEKTAAAGTVRPAAGVQSKLKPVGVGGKASGNTNLKK